MHHHASDALMVPFLIMTLFAVFMFALFILWILALVDILRSNFTEPSKQTLWLLVVLFTGPIGTALYWFIGINQKKRKDENVYVQAKQEGERVNIPRIIKQRPPIEKDDRDFSFK